MMDAYDIQCWMVRFVNITEREGLACFRSRIPCISVSRRITPIAIHYTPNNPLNASIQANKTSDAMPPRRRSSAVVSAAPKTSVRTATKARARPKAQPKPRAAARKTSTLSAMIGSDDDDEEEESAGDEQQEQEQQSSADEQEEDEGEEDELSAAQGTILLPPSPPFPRAYGEGVPR